MTASQKPEANSPGIPDRLLGTAMEHLSKSLTELKKGTQKKDPLCPYGDLVKNTTIYVETGWISSALTFVVLVGGVILWVAAIVSFNLRAELQTVCLATILLAAFAVRGLHKTQLSLSNSTSSIKLTDVYFGTFRRTTEWPFPDLTISEVNLPADPGTYIVLRLPDGGVRRIYGEDLITELRKIKKRIQVLREKG
ncbi:MAG: hypothetical protein R3C49_01710 [Planctomycetaceae bacterium]